MADGQSTHAAAVEITVEAGEWPPEETLRELVEAAVTEASKVADLGEPHSLGILFAGDEQIRALNARFRGKDKPTNVLSFPAPGGPRLPAGPPHLGDIALAYETVAREAGAEEKPFEHHLTHLIVHGFLHLVGYDHETEEEAEEMEGLERDILKTLAIGDPYA